MPAPLAAPCSSELLAGRSDLLRVQPDMFAPVSIFSNADRVSSSRPTPASASTH